ncbi:MAG: OmpA family protein [Bacteroidaceae bacterium]
MKKLMFALAFAGMSTVAMAQDTVEVPQMKYSVATNSFWSNWFISAGGDYMSTSPKKASWSLFKKENSNFGWNAAVGKWFTPGLGLRLKFNGIVGLYDSHHSRFRAFRTEAMFNLSNILCGYNENRVWNVTPFVGMAFLNEGKNGFDVGLQSSWKVSKHFNIFAEASLILADRDGGFEKIKNNYDKYVDVSVGLTYNIGKSNWKKTPDVNALMAMNKEQMDALNASLKEQQNESASLKDMLAKQKNQKTTTVNTTTVVSTNQSVFFNIGSSKIASKKDLVNVKEVAEYAKANNLKIVVKGYADSKTGSASYNKKLSEKRANAVANELVKMGVNRDNIVIDVVGGTAELSPFNYNRRATVKIQ